MPDRGPAKLTITVLPDLHQTLQAYSAACERAYGVSEPLTELIPAIFAAFLESDRGYLRFRSLHLTPGAACPEQFIKLDEVCRHAGFGKTTTYAIIKDGRFPRPYKISPAAARWSEHELVA